MPRPRAAFAAALALAACAALLLTTGAAAKQKNKKNQQPTTGRIEVSTQPGGYPITIDGQPAGETTDYVRAIELDPGQHTVEIVFPNNTRWAQTFNIIAGRKNCVALNYRPRTIEIPAIAVSPCPYPVNVTAPAQVADGDIVTFTADVGYQGPSALNYTWTVSPPAARILSGVGTPTITVDSSGLGNKRVTAILVVDDGSGDRSCRQTAQAATGVSGLPTITPAKRFDEVPEHPGLDRLHHRLRRAQQPRGRGRPHDEARGRLPLDQPRHQPRPPRPHQRRPPRVEQLRAVDRAAGRRGPAADPEPGLTRRKKSTANSAVFPGRGHGASALKGWSMND
jgi:hypothetical protein